MASVKDKNIDLCDRPGLLVSVGVSSFRPEYLGVIADRSFQNKLGGSELVAVWRLGSQSKTPKAVVKGKVWIESIRVAEMSGHGNVS